MQCKEATAVDFSCSKLTFKYTALTRMYPANPTTRASMPQMAYSVWWACSCFDACNTDDASFYLTDAGFYLTISTSFKISTKQHLLALIRGCWQLPPSASDWNSKHWFTASFFQPLSWLLMPQVSKNCQLTDSFSLVFKWQWAYNRQLKLFLASLS